MLSGHLSLTPKRQVFGLPGRGNCLPHTLRNHLHIGQTGSMDFALAIRCVSSTKYTYLKDHSLAWLLICHIHVKNGRDLFYTRPPSN